MKNLPLSAFEAWDKRRKVQTEGPQRVTLRAEERTSVYLSRSKDFSDEILCALGEGELNIETRAGDYLRVKSDGRVWIAVGSKNQFREQSDESFTTLDRPAPISPEMAAIMQMMKRNERERQNDRTEIQRLMRQRDAVRQKQPLYGGGNDETAPQDTSQETDSVREDTSAGDANSAE